MFKNIHYDFKTKKIHIWETFNDKNLYSIEDFEYTYFTEDPNRKSNITDIYGNPVIEKKTKSPDSIELLKNSGAVLCESDLKEDVAFLQSKYRDADFQTDMNDFNVAFLDIEVQFEDVFPDPEKADYPINLLTVVSSKTGKTTTWGNQDYTGNSDLVGDYYYIPDETKMLESFVSWWRKQKFDIVTGWNVLNFDIQYILNRLDKLEIKKTLSPINKITNRVIEDREGKRKFIGKIAGLSILDFMELYKKFTYTMLESYSLNFVSMHEEVGGKIDLDGHINDAYRTNWNQFVEYNIMDTILVQKLEEKKRFIALTITLASQSLVPFEKVFSSVATIEGYILRHLHKNGMVMPDRYKPETDIWRNNGMFRHNEQLQNVKHEDGEKIFYPFFVKGGHVEANPGMYRDVLSFDVESLYPTNIMQYNISPETKVLFPSETRIKEDDLIKTPINQVYYKRKKGIFPQIIEKIFKERKDFKNLMEEYENSGDKEKADYYDSQQMIRKILLNSIYGVMINEYFHFYDVDNARVVTRGGRSLIRYLSSCTNKYFMENWHDIAKEYFPDLKEYPKLKNTLVKVVDTDSNYICLSEIKDNYAPDMPFLDFALYMEEKVFNPFYDQILQIWADRYGTEQKVNFKREGVITKQFVLAKKKYLTELIMQEHVKYDKPKLKATGVEIKRSDTPKFCRDNIEKIVGVLFEGRKPSKKATMEAIRKIKKDFKREVIKDISFNKGVNKYTKYSLSTEEYIKNCGITYKKSTPIHVKASMNFNYMIKKYKLPYMEISNGTKVKYVFVNPDNILGSPVMAYVGNWPEEFDKWFKIDFDYQFEKSFLGVIQRMFDVLEWGNINLKENKLAGFLN